MGSTNGGRLADARTGWRGFSRDLLIPLLTLAENRGGLRRCANPACRLVFEDGSLNHTRRWCDTAACGNRDRVRRARSLDAVAPTPRAASLDPTGEPYARHFRRDRGTISQMASKPAAEQHLRDLAWLRRVRDRIDREYAQPLDVEALARGAHMSAGHLSREFRLAYGESPYSYLMTRRIERAMALLRRGDLSVTEVCFDVGCSSLGTFSSRFSELVGMSPSAYPAPRGARDRRGCHRAWRSR